MNKHVFNHTRSLLYTSIKSNATRITNNMLHLQFCMREVFYNVYRCCCPQCRFLHWTCFGCQGLLVGIQIKLLLMQIEVVGDEFRKFGLSREAADRAFFVLKPWNQIGASWFPSGVGGCLQLEMCFMWTIFFPPWQVRYSSAIGLLFHCGPFSIWMFEDFFFSYCNVYIYGGTTVFATPLVPIACLFDLF